MDAFDYKRFVEIVHELGCMGDFETLEQCLDDGAFDLDLISSHVAELGKMIKALDEPAQAEKKPAAEPAAAEKKKKRQRT